MKAIFEILLGILKALSSFKQILRWNLLLLSYSFVCGRGQIEKIIFFLSNLALVVTFFVFDLQS